MNPKRVKKLIVGFIGGANNHHCDNFRGDKQLLINPTELPNCIDRFIYTVKERGNEGGVKQHSDAKAEEAITNLNLNAPILRRQRATIVKDAANLFESKCRDKIN
jgi:hypothetical protein